MSDPTTVTITYQVHDKADPDLFDMPTIGLRLTTTVDFTDGHWVVSTDAPWGQITAKAERRDTAMLRLVAMRLGDVETAYPLMATRIEPERIQGIIEGPE